MSLNKIMKWIVIVSSTLFFLDTLLGMLILVVSGPVSNTALISFFDYLGYATPIINSFFLISMGWLATKSLTKSNSFTDENGGTLKRLALAIVIAIVFVPVIFAPSMLYPYIVGKAFAFRFLVLALFFVFVYLSLKNKSFWPRITPSVIAFSLLTLVMGLSTLFSIDSYKSFFGNYERMEGYITTVYTLLLLISLTALRLKDIEWRKVFVIHFGVSMFVSGMGVLQFVLGKITASSAIASLPIIGLCVNKVACKVDSTLGNSIYLGVYAALSMWIILYVIYRFRPQKNIEILWIGVAVNFIALYASGARGSLLGLIVGILVAVLVYLLINKMNKKAIILIAASFAIASLFAITVWYTKKIGIAQNIPIVSKFASTNTLFTRLNVWQTAVASFKQKPVLGWGQENFIHAFNKNYNPAMYGQETYFDHPHNTYLGWLAMGGALGFIAYILFLISILWATIKSYKTEDIRGDVGLAIAIGAITTYLFHIFFVFDSLTSTLLFIFLAVYFTRNISFGSIKMPSLEAKQLKVVLIVLALAFTLVSYLYWWKPAYANMTLIKALSTNSATPIETVNKANALFQKAINMNTFGSYEARELYLQKAMEYAGLINQIADKDVQAAIVKFNQDALAKFDVQANNSYDHKAKFMLGIYYSNLQSLDNAEKVLIEALALAPNKQVAMLSLARVYLLKGDIVKSLEIYKRAVDVTPTNSTQYNALRIQYIQALMLSGKDAEATAVIKDLLPVSNRQEFQVLVSSMMQVYGGRKDLKALIATLSDAIQLDPRNENFVLWLSQALVLTGNYEAAANQIENLRVVNPEFVNRFKAELQALVNENSKKQAEAAKKEESKVATTTSKASSTKSNIKK